MVRIHAGQPVSLGKTKVTARLQRPCKFWSPLPEPHEDQPRGRVKFPVHVKYRTGEAVSIYRKGWPYYKVRWPGRRDGRRRSVVRAFRRYSDTKALAEKRAKELYEGSKAVDLTSGQAGLMTKAEGEAWFEVAAAKPKNVVRLNPSKNAS